MVMELPAKALPTYLLFQMGSLVRGQGDILIRAFATIQNILMWVFSRVALLVQKEVETTRVISPTLQAPVYFLCYVCPLVFKQSQSPLEDLPTA